MKSVQGTENSEAVCLFSDDHALDLQNVWRVQLGDGRPFCEVGNSQCDSLVVRE